MEENGVLEKKSIRKIRGKTADFKQIAKECVCLANSIGGKILIGIEDGESIPPSDQRIAEGERKALEQKIKGQTINVGINAVIIKHENGADYISVQVSRNETAIASTTDGKYYIRSSEECKPVMPEDLTRLISEKNGFVWEERIVRKVSIDDSDHKKFKKLCSDIRSSERVSEFIKDKSDEEIVEHYMLTINGYLTNLGALWIGKQSHRAILHYAPSIQFIKYNESDEKIKKLVWDDYSQNPMELLEQIMNSIPEWDEFIEVSDGAFRKNIYNYDKDVIREIIANALVHRNYSTMGDIFINLYVDRVEIHSPGLLPLGVTPNNILTKSVQRNRLLSRLFHDLKLMEKEGSGYDLVYELQLKNGKALPEVIEDSDRVIVTIYRNIVDRSVLRLMTKASNNFTLKQKEVITLGIIAQKNGIHAHDLSNLLNIVRPNGLKSWMGKLIEHKLVLSKGKTKGTFYYVNPKVLKDFNFIAKTNLKKIEPHRLRHLIIEDLREYPGSFIGEIRNRIGEEIKQRTLKANLDMLIKDNHIIKTGDNRWTKYSLNKNG